MRLLITGGCGFVGSNLAAEGLDRGWSVTVFDNMRRDGAAENLAWLRQRGPVAFMHGDIRDADDVSEAVTKTRPGAVFHLAGQVAMTTSIERPRLDFEINALGTLNVLEAVRLRCPDAAVLYSSSNKVYGDLEWLGLEETPTRWRPSDGRPGLREDAPFAPSTPYGVSKAAADSLMQDYARVFGLKTIVFRHSTMYGGRQFATIDQGWIGWFCAQAIATVADPTHRFTMSGDGKQVRDVLHARDVVDLYFRAVERADSVGGEVFNIGGGETQSLSLLELFAHLETKTGVRLNIDALPARPFDQRYFVADTTKASDRLGWAPTGDTSLGLDEMLEWAAQVERERGGR